MITAQEFMKWVASFIVLIAWLMYLHLDYQDAVDVCVSKGHTYEYCENHLGG